MQFVTWLILTNSNWKPPFKSFVMFGGRTTEKCIDCQKYNFLWCKYFPCTSTQLPFWQLITVTSIADKWHRSFWKHFFKSYRLFCTVNHFTNISRTATFCSVMISHAYIYSVHLENVCGSTEHSSNLNWSYAKLFCPDR